MVQRRKKKTTAKRKGSAKKTATRRRKVVRRKKTTTRRKTTGRKKTTTRRKTTGRKKTTTRRKTTGRKQGKKRAGGGLTKMKYSCSSSLMAIVGTGKLTRPQIVKKIWAYIKAKKCQHATNRRMIVPDAKLAKVIGSRPIDMLKLATHMNKHIKK